MAQVSASWAAVTTNQDGTILEDLEGYSVRWRYLSDPLWNFVSVPNGESASWSPVTPGVAVRVQVAAFDRAGNYSGWSEFQDITTGADATPPEIPSAPLVDNYLGMLRIRWDGKTVSGAALAPDFDHVEVHLSSTDNFTPDATTLIDSLVTGGSSFAQTPYGQARFAKLVAVDRSGNKSDPSAQGSASTTQVVSPDIFDGAVGSAKIADLAITTAKINDLAVNDAKIGSVSVGKLTAGIMSAEVTISGRFATALTGQRVEINGQGIYRFDSTGAQTVAIDGNGALLTGRYRTAASGRRIEMGQTSGTTGRIDFYAPNGANAYILAYTEGTGLEALQMGIAISGINNSLWNRINYNTDEWANYRAWRHEFYILNSKTGRGATTGDGLFHIMQTSNPDSTAGEIERFTISQTRLMYANPNGKIQLEIASNQTAMWDWNGKGRFYIYTAGGTDLDYWDAAGVNRIHQEGDRINFLPANNPGSLAGFYGFAGWTGGSAVLRFSTPTGHASNFKLWSDANGDWFEMKDWTDSVWYGVRAGAFANMSDAKVKVDVANFTDAALPQLLKTKVRKYRRRNDSKPIKWKDKKEKDGRLIRVEDGPDMDYVSPIGREEIGLIAQEAPPQIVVPMTADELGIDLYQYTALVHKGLQEIVARLEELEKGGKK